MHYTVGVLSFLSFLRLCWSVFLFLSSVEHLGDWSNPDNTFFLFFVSFGFAYGYTGSGWVFFFWGGTYGGFCFLSRVYCLF